MVLGAVFEALNRMPEEQHGANIMRVRHAYLDGLARRLRQTIVLSSFAHVQLNALLHRRCACIAGRAVLRPCSAVSPVGMSRLRLLICTHACSG